MYSEIRNKIGSIISSLCQQKGLGLHEGHAMPDHIHLLLSIPPKFSVSNTVRFIKGKSTIKTNPITMPPSRGLPHTTPYGRGW